MAISELEAKHLPVGSIVQYNGGYKYIIISKEEFDKLNTSKDDLSKLVFYSKNADGSSVPAYFYTHHLKDTNIVYRAPSYTEEELMKEI